MAWLSRPGRYAFPIAIVGWLLLAVGMVILGSDGLPRSLEALNIWLQPRLADFRVDAPMPPGVWLPGLLLLLIGMVLIGWTGAGVIRLPGAPAFTIRSPRTATGPRFSPRWFVLVLASILVWQGVVLAAVMSSTHWAVTPLWLAAMAVQAVCWWRVDRARGVSHFPARMGRSVWLVVLALVVALGVMLYSLKDVPNSIWKDERAFWWWTRELASGMRVNPFDLGVYDAFPVMSSFYQSLWVKAFGPTVWSWRLGSVVAGTLTVIPLFFLTRRLLGARVAWSAVVLMISMPYFLAYARTGYNNIQPLLPVTVGLWLLVEALQRHSRLFAYLAGVACGMASLTYMAGHIGLVLVILVWLFFFIGFIGRRPLRRLLLELGLCLVVGWLLAAGPFVLGSVLSGKPMALKVAESFFGNAFYGETIFSTAEITRRYPLWQVGREQVFFEPKLYGLLVGRGVLRTALNMVTDGVFTEHYIVGPMAGPGTAFFLAGLAWTLGQCRRLPVVLWTVWTLLCVVLFSMLNTFPPRMSHMTPSIPALAVLAAVGIWLLSDLLRRFIHPRWAGRIGVVLTVVLALCGLRTYFVVMPRRYRPDLENVMFWRAQEMGRGSNLVFVEGAPYAPGFRVWGIDQFDLGVEYHGVPAEEVQATDFHALCGTSCRVFFLPKDAEAVLAQLHAQLGEGTIRSYVDPKMRIIGLEFEPRLLEAGAPASGWMGGVERKKNVSTAGGTS